MGTYISSNANRFYAAIESSYGKAMPASPANRFPAVRLEAQQILERGKRLDKTGTRSYPGTATTSRRRTAFEVRTYLTSWFPPKEPGYGPLFQAALGATPQSSSGLIAASAEGKLIQTTTPHGLSAGSGIAYGNEMRFVTAVPDSSNLVLNAPFLNTLAPNAALMTTVTYRLSTALPSVTLYDYWDPISAVSRIVTGAAVDLFSLSINGDFHEFAFSGPAAGLLNSNTSLYDDSGLSSFPAEPLIGDFDYSIVPGHLGEIWIGSAPNQFFTMTQASVEVKNNIDLRNREFGAIYPRAVAAGPRQVSSTFTILAQDDVQTAALYDAARRRAPVPAMIQLGQQNGQLMGVFLPAVTPEIPNYDDSQSRLQWEFKNNLAQGGMEDELYIAFG